MPLTAAQSAAFTVSPTLTRAAAGALTDATLSSRFDVWFGAINVTATDLQKIGWAINEGKIGVYYDPSFLIVKSVQEGFYSPAVDSFFLGFTDTSSMWNRGIIVHEAVHAVNDMYSRAWLNKLDNEALAFVAYVMYARIKGFKGKAADIPGVVNDKAQAMLDAAFAVADAMLTSRTTSTTLEDTLRKALKELKPYRTFQREYDSLDGIPGVAEG